MKEMYKIKKVIINGSMVYLCIKIKVMGMKEVRDEFWFGLMYIIWFWSFLRFIRCVFGLSNFYIFKV